MGYWVNYDPLLIYWTVRIKSVCTFFFRNLYSCKNYDKIVKKTQRKEKAKQKHFCANTTQKDFENYCTLHKKSVSTSIL